MLAPARCHTCSILPRLRFISLSGLRSCDQPCKVWVLRITVSAYASRARSSTVRPVVSEAAIIRQTRRPVDRHWRHAERPTLPVPVPFPPPAVHGAQTSDQREYDLPVRTPATAQQIRER